MRKSISERLVSTNLIGEICELCFCFVCYESDQCLMLICYWFIGVYRNVLQTFFYFDSKFFCAMAPKKKDNQSPKMASKNAKEIW